MGTVFSFDIRDDVAPDALDEVIGWLRFVDATFSTYLPDSEISRLRRAELTLAECTPDVVDVVQRCAELTACTGGYFDAGAGRDLDPSGYVKGWAIERASDMLRAAGSKHHCVNGGGDVQCIGVPEPGRLWQVGIAHPLDRTLLVGTVTGSPLAVATSGTSERGAHIVDPHTGAPAATFASVTVVGQRLADVDAFATAAFAMGDGAVDWLRARKLQALLVYADGTCTRIAGA